MIKTIQGFADSVLGTVASGVNGGLATIISQTGISNAWTDGTGSNANTSGFSTPRLTGTNGHSTFFRNWGYGTGSLFLVVASNATDGITAIGPGNILIGKPATLKFQWWSKMVDLNASTSALNNTNSAPGSAGTNFGGTICYLPIAGNSGITLVGNRLSGTLVTHLWINGVDVASSATVPIANNTWYKSKVWITPGTPGTIVVDVLGISLTYSATIAIDYSKQIKVGMLSGTYYGTYYFDDFALLDAVEAWAGDALTDLPIAYDLYNVRRDLVSDNLLNQATVVPSGTAYSALSPNTAATVQVATGGQVKCGLEAVPFTDSVNLMKTVVLGCARVKASTNAKVKYGLITDGVLTSRSVGSLPVLPTTTSTGLDAVVTRGNAAQTADLTLSQANAAELSLEGAV
jgi:hypothetical protein